VTPSFSFLSLIFGRREQKEKILFLMEDVMSNARFSLGRVVATPGALEAMADAGQGAIEFLRRHVTGDWGELTPEDWAENELSVKEGFRILSAYHTSKGVKLYLVVFQKWT
jgi:hypothetical protein